MKKPIIALLTLAGATIAETVSISDVSFTDLSDISRGSYVNFTELFTHTSTDELTVAVTLDIEKLQGYMAEFGSKTTYLLVNVHDPSNGSIGVTTNYTSYTSGEHNGTIKTSGLYGSSGGNQTNNGNIGMGTGIGFEASSFWDNADCASLVLTFHRGDEGATAIFTLGKGANTQQFGGTWWNVYSGNANITNQIYEELYLDNSVINAYIANGAVSVETAKSIGYALIPEPTTATLSLLALAGLAARRRRR